MSLEFRHGELVVRVDGDVCEIFWKGSFSHRLLLEWLAVKVQPSIKQHLIVKIMSSPRALPLYEVLPKAKGVVGSVFEVVIRAGEEPMYRHFFTQVAHLCGRPVAP